MSLHVEWLDFPEPWLISLFLLSCFSFAESLTIQTTFWLRSCWCWLPTPSILHPNTCTGTGTTPTWSLAMATSTDPGSQRLDPEPASQSGAVVNTLAAMTIKDPDGSTANGVRHGGSQQGGAPNARPARPHLTGRKLSLQERGTYLSPGSGGSYNHISPRVARKPTVESKRVSISDSQVRGKKSHHILIIFLLFTDSIFLYFIIIMYYILLSFYI